MTDIRKLSQDFSNSAREWARHGLRKAGTAVGHAGEALTELSHKIEARSQKLADCAQSGKSSAGTGPGIDH